jgi:hypothetical protein
VYEPLRRRATQPILFTLLELPVRADQALSPLGQFDEAIDLGSEDVRYDRLEDIVHGPVPVAPDDVPVLLVVGRHEDDRHRPSALSLPDARRRVIAIQAAELDVEQDHTDILIEEEPQSRLSRGGFNDRAAGAAKQGFEGDETFWTVVDKQDVDRLAERLGRHEAPQRKRAFISFVLGAVCQV